MLEDNIIRGRFVDELNARMTGLGLTAGDVAIHSRTMKHRIISYMRGDSLPNVWTLVLIAEYLNCTVNDLLGYDKVNNSRILEKEIAFNKYKSESEFAFLFKERTLKRMKTIHMAKDDLCKHANISLQSVDRWLWLYPRLPQTMNLLRICDTLDCTPSEILGY